MDPVSYHITIKKEYASAILEDLQQKNAIEMIQDEIPQWQIDESLRRLKKMKADPASGINSDTFYIDIPDDSE